MAMVQGVASRYAACLLLMQEAKRLTLTSGTFFHGGFSPLALIQEEQVVSYW